MACTSRHLLVLLVLLCMSYASGTILQQPGTATITTEDEFMTAILDNTVSVIKLGTNLTLVPASWYDFNYSSPLLLTRNVTVSSELLPYPWINFAFLTSKIQIGEGILFKFEKVVSHMLICSCTPGLLFYSI